MASSTLISSTNDPDSSSIRPRNRRLISVESTNATSSPEPSIRGTARLAPGTPTPLRDASPLPTSRLDVAPPERGQRRDSSRRKRSPATGGGGSGGGFGFGLLDGSWAAGWGTVQGIAAGWLSGASTENNRNSRARAGSRSASQGRELGRKASRPWAQDTAAAATANARPTIQDVGAGIMAEREAALIAARTASVLESHDGVNGGLDVAGRFKRRTSDDIARRSADGAGEAEEILAYIHHVKPTDTYVGVILKYGCREEPFKKLNGLWSRDSLLTRKWVAMPVDACEVKGKPCAGPSAPDEKVDLLAPTPEAEIDDYGWRGRASSSTTQQHVDDIFGPSANGSHKPPNSEEEEEEEEKMAQNSDQPWSHVRWVSLDSFPEPVEIGRISRKAFGYFPPRRKRSLLNASSPFSTPRQSFDVQSSVLGSGDGPDRGGPSSRRQSTLSNRPNIPGSTAGTGMSTPASARSRVGSVGTDTRPMWMRRPGGVGSLNQSVRTPGPDKDPLNTWAKKHFPSLIIDNLPSMSVLGAETAHLGFPGDIGVIAESAPADGGDATALARQGTGLDRAAAAVETWLRGAFAKRPGTPMMGQGQWGGEEDVSDLIELTDTQGEDDKRTTAAAEPSHARLPTLPRTGRDGSRGRPDVGASTAASGAKLRASARVASSVSLGRKSTGKDKDD